MSCATQGSAGDRHSGEPLGAAAASGCERRTRRTLATAQKKLTRKNQKGRHHSCCGLERFSFIGLHPKRCGHTNRASVRSKACQRPLKWVEELAAAACRSTEAAAYPHAYQPARADATPPILTDMESQFMKVRSLARKVLGSTRDTLHSASVRPMCVLDCRASFRLAHKHTSPWARLVSALQEMAEQSRPQAAGAVEAAAAAAARNSLSCGVIVRAQGHAAAPALVGHGGVVLRVHWCTRGVDLAF
jgi:hypothetical protein